MEQESTRGGKRPGAGRKSTTIEKEKARTLNEIWENFGKENFALAVKKGHRWALRLLIEILFGKEQITAEDKKSFEDYVREHGLAPEPKEIPGDFHQDQDQGKENNTLESK